MCWRFGHIQSPHSAVQRSTTDHSLISASIPELISMSRGPAKTPEGATFTTYLGNQHDVAECYVGSQSLQSFGFIEELVVVSKEWADRSEFSSLCSPIPGRRPTHSRTSGHGIQEDSFRGG
jgi:hypothetical protein